MLNTIVAQNNPSWQAHFNIEQAIASVFAHVASLPSSRTDEKYTAHVYKAGLEYYLSMYGDDLPTPFVIQSYIAHLSARGLTASTISAKYLAPLRHYLRALASQVEPTSPSYIFGMAHQIGQAAAVKSPRQEFTSHVSPLWRVGKRIELPQIRAVLNIIDRTTLAGLRDYALLLVAFSTGLRLAELSRITTASITPSGDGVYLITVRGKRNNIDPVPISAQVKNAIDAYITAYNTIASTPLTDTVSLWQPIRKGGNNPAPLSTRGMSHNAIRDLMAKWTEIVLGEPLAPHDFRRTAAATAYSSGMDMIKIQQLLRHADPSTTAKYIGTKPTYADRVLPLAI